MTARMLIDARHREETRVAVVQGNRIEEFDFESAERKQLKGNIYLAKVTRVEPSLQAAFIDYGGNRHGFLAFSEIHPDYYQIPKEDREALLREEAEHAAEEERLRSEADYDDEEEPEARADTASDDDETDDEQAEADGTEDAPPPAPRTAGQDDQVEALRQRRQNLRRRYKIQDVIRRRQVLLVQVVKEERGNKGAALTTYLSLAGRYCVLMPNTSHGGGISRKISNAADRKRLKTIMAELQLPPSMGCIVRTAGLQRTKTEIKRDFDYLARLWDEIRDRTLGSSAPAQIHGDSDLIKRAVRDIYNKDIDEVIVEGEDGFRQAKDFMRLLMPSHARKVKHYSDPVPLFQRCHVEDQLAAMYHPVVQLKSGGYLVINPTEALVSIDINSGRSTREHNIEQTATATNLEAAAEIARQLRLRDMAGLVVIDFIDMDNGSNVRKVERAMKDALKNDRARIQVGRISSFGLMEMSRQRLRTGVLEASTRGCPHCEGTGLVRTASSAGLSALRLIEDEAARGRGSLLTLRASQEAAVYVLNRKRADIAEIEDRYGVSVEILPDRDEEGARMSVEASGPPPAHAPRFAAPIEEIDEELPDEIEVDEEEAEVADDEPAPVAARAERAERPERAEDDDRGGRGRRRRRRGRRGRRPEGEAEGDVAETGDEEAGDAAGEEIASDDVDETAVPAPVSTEAKDEVGGEGRRRRGRRGRRGSRRDEGTEGNAEIVAADVDAVPELVAAEAGALTEEEGAADAEALPSVPDPVAEAPTEPELPIKAIETPAAEPQVDGPQVDEPAEAATAEPAPKPRRSRRKAATADGDGADGVPATDASGRGEVDSPKPRRGRRKAVAAEAEGAAPVDAEPTADAEPAADAAPAPRRRSRRKPAADTAAEIADTADAAEPTLPMATAPADAEATAPPVDDAPGATPADEVLVAADADDTDESAAPADQDGSGAAPRRGWWQRTFGN